MTESDYVKRQGVSSLHLKRWLGKVSLEVYYHKDLMMCTPEGRAV